MVRYHCNDHGNGNISLFKLIEIFFFFDRINNFNTEMTRRLFHALNLKVNHPSNILACASILIVSKIFDSQKYTSMS